MTPSRALLAALFVAGLLAASAPGAEEPIQDRIRTQQEELEKLRRQAEDARKKAAQLATREKGVLETLREAEGAIAATKRYLKGLEEREAMLAYDMERTDRQLGQARSDLAERRHALKQRLRHSYMHGRTRPLEVVFSASTFPQLLQRASFLGRVLQHDRKLVVEVEARQAEVETQLRALRDKRAEIGALQVEKASEQSRYEDMRAKRARDLSRVRDEKGHHERAAAELEKAAKEMQRLIADLERKRIAAMQRDDQVLAELDRQNFGRNRGLLPWPVAGNVLSEFGRHEHPKYKTVTLNNGIDIEAPTGSAVRCVGDGVVEMVRWLNGYGLSVIVNHGRGYYSIYSHLSAAHVAADERVEPGQVIGSVGDSGSLKGPCLHFEIREGSQARDPRQWLR